ncbi:MAG TPA: hypothetical protein VF403_26775 [Kofleriaceae bacterium]
MQRLAISLTCLLALAASAHAEPDSPPHVSLTIEPLYLIVTMVDATAEVRVAPRVGAAVIAGYGRPLLGAALWNLGGEVNAYVMRDFSGLHVGAELQYMGGSFGIPFVTETMPTNPLRIYGGYVGYKCVTRRGFTSVLQAGVGHISGGGTSTDAPMSKVIPIANFTAGWSF